MMIKTVSISLWGRSYLMFSRVFLIHQGGHVFTVCGVWVSARKKMWLRWFNMLWCHLSKILQTSVTSSTGKGILFSSEQGSVVTGKAWGFSVLFLTFLFYLIVVLCVFSSSFFFSNSSCLPPELQPLPFGGMHLPPVCRLTQRRDVGTTTRGHYNTATSRPDGEVIWGWRTWGKKMIEKIV